MEAKLKAVEIYNKCIDYSYTPFMGGGDEMTNEIAAKELSLIVADEVIDALVKVSVDESGDEHIDFGQNYWREVKKEIELL